VIDRAGVLRAEFLPGNGALSEAQLEAALTPLLIEAPSGENP
jgi:hypothetical protein